MSNIILLTSSSSSAPRLVERRWPPLNYETSDEEELSATFDSLGQDELDVHQFEAMAGASATDESCRYSTQSFQDYSFRAAAAAVVPAPCSRQRPTIVRSNTPPPLGNTITPLRYYTYYHRICSRIARLRESSCCAAQGYTNHVVYTLTHAIQSVFLFRGGWLDCQREPFGRAQRYLLHLLVRIDLRQRMRMFLAFISHIIALKIPAFFFNLSGAGSQWAWWLVWPIWFCPTKTSEK